MRRKDSRQSTSLLFQGSPQPWADMSRESTQGPRMLEAKGGGPVRKGQAVSDLHEGDGHKVVRCVGLAASISPDILSIMSEGGKLSTMSQGVAQGRGPRGRCIL